MCHRRGKLAICPLARTFLTFESGFSVMAQTHRGTSQIVYRIGLEGLFGENPVYGDDESLSVPKHKSLRIPYSGCNFCFQFKPVSYLSICQLHRCAVHIRLVCKKYFFFKSRIRETKNLLTDADRRTDKISERLPRLSIFAFFFLLEVS